MNNIDATYEESKLTPAFLAQYVSDIRQKRGWTQETLAHLAGLTVRTIQRIEKSEPSNFHTRRAIAKAFDLEDIDILNKPWLPNLTYEVYQQTVAEFERYTEEQTMCISLKKISTGRQLRELVESGHAYIAHQLLELTENGEGNFAHLIDYIRDNLPLN